MYHFVYSYELERVRLLLKKKDLWEEEGSDRSLKLGKNLSEGNEANKARGVWLV